METESIEFQKFLDNQQYTTTGIRQYELVFGETFVCPGGLESCKELASYLNLKAGQKCLDVGCGLGGNAFYLAKHFDVEVLGLDLSTNMINIAREYANGRYKDDRVSFDVADVTTSVFEESSIDVIYSQSVLIHIEDRHSLYEKCWKWLKPGGRLFISEYTRSPGNHSQAFTEYIKKRGYYTFTVEQHSKILENTGFRPIAVKDNTAEYTAILQEELARLENMREEYIKEFSMEEYNHIEAGWQDKIRWSQGGEQGFGLFSYEKQ